MQNIINSFKAHLYERTTSPLLGAFVFYWLIFNYKMIVILFDNKLESNVKFSNIDTIYKNDFIYNIPLNGLIYPLLATLIYLLIFPFASNFIYRLWIKHQDELKRISNKQLHTDKEFGELREDFLKLQLSFNETFKSKNIEISDKDKIITDKDKTISDYEKTISDYKDRENKKIEEYRDIFSSEFYQNHEIERRNFSHYISLLEPDNSVLKTLSVDENIILYTIYNHKDKKIWNVLTASPFTTVGAGKKLLEKGLIENIDPEHYQLSEEGEKIFK